MIDPETNLRLHALRQLLNCWNSITGQTTRMVPSVERSLYEFQKFYTMGDLELTLGYVVHKNKKSTSPWSLTFEKFFDDEFKHFESIRSQAEQHKREITARKRQWQAGPADKTLAEFRRTEPKPPEQSARHVDSLPLIQALKRAAQ